MIKYLEDFFTYDSTPLRGTVILGGCGAFLATLLVLANFTKIDFLISNLLYMLGLLLNFSILFYFLRQKSGPIHNYDTTPLNLYIWFTVLGYSGANLSMTVCLVIYLIIKVIIDMNMNGLVSWVDKKINKNKSKLLWIY